MKFLGIIPLSSLGFGGAIDWGLHLTSLSGKVKKIDFENNFFFFFKGS